MDWTITILRSARGEALFDDMVRRGLLEARPMEEFENSMKVMLRLTQQAARARPGAAGADAARRPARRLSGGRFRSGRVSLPASEAARAWHHARGLC